MKKSLSISFVLLLMVGLLLSGCFGNDSSKDDVQQTEEELAVSKVVTKFGETLVAEDAEKLGSTLAEKDLVEIIEYEGGDPETTNYNNKDEFISDYIDPTTRDHLEWELSDRVVSVTDNSATVTGDLLMKIQFLGALKVTNKYLQDIVFKLVKENDNWYIKQVEYRNAQAEALTYKDEFNNSDSGWSVVDEAEKSSRYIDGQFEISVLEKTDWNYYFYAPIFPLNSPYTVQVEMEVIKNTGAGGLIFNEVGSAYYLAKIDTNGYLDVDKNVDKNQDDSWEGVLYRDVSQYLTSGKDKLKLMQLQDKLKLYVNGTFIKELSISLPATEIDVGLSATSSNSLPVTVRYDNFEVGQIN